MWFSFWAMCCACVRACSFAGTRDVVDRLLIVVFTGPISIKKQYANQNNRSIHMKINRRKCMEFRELMRDREREFQRMCVWEFVTHCCCFTSFKCSMCVCLLLFFLSNFYYFILSARMESAFISDAVVFMCQHSHLINNHATRKTTKRIRRIRINIYICAWRWRQA